MSNRIIYWFRNDLRLNDNEAFWAAVGAADDVLPVYVFDPRRFRNREPGFRKTGINRALHILEGVSELQKRIAAKGGNLVIRVGEPERIVAELAEKYDVIEVRASKEITLEETNIEASLSKKLKGINVDISLTWMNTLIHPHDLPFYISRLPENFAAFREKVKNLPVRKPVAELVLKQTELTAHFSLPSLKELGFSEGEIRGVGNSEATVDRGTIGDAIREGKASLQEILDGISFGQISPREAFQLTNGSEVGQELHAQLLWRDYLLFVVLKYGTRLFKPSGLVHQVDKHWLYDKALFLTWAEGRTADSQVNEYMKRLSETGTLGFEASGVVARYLAENLGVNWTWGAAWFESQLSAYEVALNWGNWNFFVGVGFESGSEAGQLVS